LKYDDTIAIGYSLLSMTHALILGGMLVMGFVAMSDRTPCSLAVSVAGHPNAGDEDAASKSIMYLEDLHNASQLMPIS